MLGCVHGDEDHLRETNGLIESSSTCIYELYTGRFQTKDICICNLLRAIAIIELLNL